MSHMSEHCVGAHVRQRLSVFSKSPLTLGITGSKIVNVHFACAERNHWLRGEILHAGGKQYLQRD